MLYECMILLTVREGSNEPEARVLLERSCREKGERERDQSHSLFFFPFIIFCVFFFLLATVTKKPTTPIQTEREHNNMGSLVFLFFTQKWDPHCHN